MQYASWQGSYEKYEKVNNMKNEKPKGPSEQRLLWIKVEAVESKTGKNGPYIGVKLTGGKWYNCFQLPIPIPVAGEVWWCNFTESTSGDKTYKNLVDMIRDNQYTGPRKTEDQVPEQPQGQQKIKEERVVDTPKPVTHGEM